MAKLTVKCEDEELEQWRDAAWQQKLSLSAWVRQQLSAGIDVRGPQVGDGRPSRRTTPQPPDVSSPPPPEQEFVAQPPFAGPAPTAWGKCPRAAQHHINSGSKPCPKCGYPKLTEAK